MALQAVGVSNLRLKTMVMNPAELGSEKDCVDEAQQKLQCTEPTSRQRGRTTSTNPKPYKDYLKQKNEN
jgi:hypothetical protein